jgi:putative ABC transport system permease protein
MLAILTGKMIKNKGLYLCLFIACVLSVAIIAGMPAFESAIKKLMLQRELSELQYQAGLPPLVHRITLQDVQINGYGDDSIKTCGLWVQNSVIAPFGLPVAARQVIFQLKNVAAFHAIPDNTGELLRNISLLCVSDFFDHVELVAGRLPNEPADQGIIEAVVSENAAVMVPYMLGSEYFLSEKEVPGAVRFKVVGVVRMTSPADPFWVTPLSDINPYTTYETFIKTFYNSLSEGLSLFSVQWVTTFDHTAIGPENIQPIIETVETSSFNVELSNIQTLQDTVQREFRLSTFILVLLIPNLALLVLFIIMMSGLIIDHDKVEISLLYSRGAGKWQVIAMYGLQTLLIAGAAIVAGIPLSLLLCSVMGASSGFLEFARRAPLQVTATAKVFLYAAAGAGIFIVSMLLPILLSKSSSIVEERRLKASRNSKPFFEKYYLDVVLLGVSLYGYFSYQNLANLLTDTSVEVAEYTHDPLIFLISTFFLMGVAMLFARLYPYIIRVLFHLGNSFWPPAIYASLSAARSRPRSRYIMLFIIVTISAGLYSAAAARTINQNYADRALYDIGADLVIQENWPYVDPNPQYVADGRPNAGAYIIPPIEVVTYSEPPYEIFSEPAGVALTTKVYRNTKATVNVITETIHDVEVMAIYPDEFAQVSWWRGDMYSYHLNHLMNAMSVNPNVVLLSRDLMERLALSHGDEINVISPSNMARVFCYVYDALDYFPTFNPQSQEDGPAYLLVMNYELVRSAFKLEPYEIWIKKKDGALSADIERYLRDNRVAFDATNSNDMRIRQFIDPRIPQFSVKDAQAKLESVYSDPAVLSMNGLLTLSFVMTLLILIAGFFVFWIFEMRSRRLQISIMRSVGMSQGSVIAMLLWEQVLLSLLPLIAGFVLGRLGCKLFVPMFEMGSFDSPLPFRIFILAEDSLRVGIIVAAAIVLSIAILWFMAARIKLSQTLKLGEE